MTVVVVFEESVLRLICGYALQGGRTLQEKESYFEFKSDWDMHNVDELVVCLVDFN